MYTFDDRNGDSLTLRPEGTAGCVRAGIQNGLFHNQIQRLWYRGRCSATSGQKGRYRQFYQMGVEAFGLEGPDIDLEIIAITRRFWQALGLEGCNSDQHLGTADERVLYRECLVDYLSDRKNCWMKRVCAGCKPILCAFWTRKIRRCAS